MPLDAALTHNESLASLLKRVHESNARLEAVRAVLPAGVAAGVKAGPLDTEGWTLLARGGATAAKLRQCLPRVQQALKARGWPEVAIRVKVQVGVQG